ncbi:MAG: hypothetical protein V4534_00095 [Myxococcota bacterium]
MSLACQKSPNAHKSQISALAFPILYARYDNLPVVKREKPQHCSNAQGFHGPDTYHLNKVMDLCGPIPKKAELSDKTPWQVSGRPLSFHWEQDLKPDEKLQVEFTNADGFPLPSTAQIQKKQNRYITEIKPASDFPNNTVMYISATLFNAEGIKIGTWSVPFKMTGL